MSVSAITNPALRRHRLTVDDFLRMGEVGILGEEARVELIEGDFIDMVPIGGRQVRVLKPPESPSSAT